MKADIHSKRLILLVSSTFTCIAYLYLNPPLNLAAASWFQHNSGLPGDAGIALWRYLSSLVLFGLLPLLISRLLGFRPVDLGLGKGRAFLGHWQFWVLLLVLMASSVLSTPGSDLATFYPWAKTLPQLSGANPWWFVANALCYLGLYYLPWEILFRGILIVPFLPQDLDPAADWTRNRQLFLIAAMQIIPTTLMHINHPLPEILGTIPFGLVAAWLVLRYRSIWPGLIIHTSVGIAVDLVITLTRP